MITLSSLAEEISPESPAISIAAVPSAPSCYSITVFTLRNNPRTTRRGVGDYHKWIRQQIETNRPYDEWVRELITEIGRAHV